MLDWNGIQLIDCCTISAFDPCFTVKSLLACRPQKPAVTSQIGGFYILEGASKQTHLASSDRVTQSLIRAALQRPENAHVLAEVRTSKLIEQCCNYNWLSIRGNTANPFETRLVAILYAVWSLELQMLIGFKWAIHCRVLVIVPHLTTCTPCQLMCRALWYLPETHPRQSSVGTKLHWFCQSLASV